MVNFFGMMVKHIKVNGKIIWCMEKVNIIIKMVEYMKEIF